MTSSSHNLYAQFRQAFDHALPETAIETEDGTTWSFADLDQQSARIANWLDSLAVQAGHRVMVQVENLVPDLVPYLACLRAAAVHVPLNTAYQSAEPGYLVET